MTGLSDLPAWAVEKACRVIGNTERAEYEDKWPELGKIRGVALAAIKADDEHRQSERLLMTGRTEEPASQERLEQFKRDIAAELAKKSMR